MAQSNPISLGLPEQGGGLRWALVVPFHPNDYSVTLLSLSANKQSVGLLSNKADEVELQC